MKWPSGTVFCFLAICFLAEAISDKESDDNFLELLRRYMERTQRAQHLPPKRNTTRTAQVPPKRNTDARWDVLANQQFLPKRSDVRGEILQNAVRILMKSKENNMRRMNMHQSGRQVENETTAPSNTPESTTVSQIVTTSTSANGGDDGSETKRPNTKMPACVLMWLVKQIEEEKGNSLQNALKRDYDFGDIDAGARATDSTSTKLPTTTPVTTTTTTTAPPPPANTLPPYLKHLPKYILDWMRSNGML